jgi:FdhE protein
MSGGRTVADPVDIGNVAQPPFVRLPDLTTVFARRAHRLEALARDHPLADYLAFIAALTRAQEKVVAALPPGTLPGPDHVAFMHEHKLPLIDRLTWRRDASWLAALDGLLVGLARVAMPDESRAALDRLKDKDVAAREALADRVLGVDPSTPDPGEACFVSAALQIYWTRMAALLDEEAVKPAEPPGACPVCGSPAVASVVYAEGNLHGVRFLCCALCGGEWHAVRIKCAHCQSTKGIAYHHVEQWPAVKAETCDECRTYTKIVYKEKAMDADPIADDLATFGLDVLVGEAGWSRAAANPFLVPAAD